MIFNKVRDIEKLLVNLNDYLESYYNLANSIYFEFQNEPIPTDFSGSSIIRNIFVSYIINPSCEPAPPEGEFIFTEDALKKIYQDILSCE